mgnify:CR=1 FL=1
MKTRTKGNIIIEEIKIGDWYLNIEEKNGVKNPFYGKLYKANKSLNHINPYYNKTNLKKIVATTNLQLIKEGIAKINNI